MSSFSVKGEKYCPGDVVDLPPTYKGEAWLEPLEPEKKAAAVPGKIEPIAPVAAEAEEAKPIEAKKELKKPSKPKK